jgi:hypothetical protein
VGGAWRSLADVLDEESDRATDEAARLMGATVSPSGHRFPCPSPTCDMVATRGAALASHVRARHPELNGSRPDAVAGRLLTAEPDEPRTLNRPREVLLRACSEDLAPIADKLRQVGWHVAVVAVNEPGWFGVRLEVCLDP